MNQEEHAILIVKYLCDYSDAHILAKGTITANNIATVVADANNTNKKVIFKNYAPFTNCTSEINNTQVDNAKDIDIVIPIYSLTEYSDNYSKTSGSLWQCCKDIPAVNDNGAIVNFAEKNLSDSFNFKAKITGQIGDNRTKVVEIILPLKYLSNFWRTLEMLLTNCEINLILTWSENCVIVSTNVANETATFAINETKLYVPVVTLSTGDNAKLLQQLNLILKEKLIGINIYQNENY